MSRIHQETCMLFINTHFLKRRPRREYLNDKYTPRKSNFFIWFKRIIIILLLITLGLLLMLLGNLAYGDTRTSEFQNIEFNKLSQGSMLIKTNTSGIYQQVPLLHTDVDMHISGMIVRSNIKQQFKNISDNWIEAEYVFPLPENAAVDHMQIRIGGRIIEGRIKEKLDAKRAYEKAKRDGRKAALVEQQRPNLFTNTVANIAPGESIIVEIEYQQVLHYEQGNFSLRFPMAITPRYIPDNIQQQSTLHTSNHTSENSTEETISFSLTGWGHNTNQIQDATQITPPLQSAPNKINPVSINIKLNAGFPLEKLFSRYHNIIKQQTNDIITISLANGVTPSDRDFELVWTPQINHTPKAAVFSEKINTDYFQMLMLAPPIDGAHNGQPLARDINYIIDTSGSMHGISMHQAKQSLLMALDRLRLHDKFNIIQFNSITDQLFSHSQIASFENILIAKQYINRLKAEGGTEMAPALKLALNNPTDTYYVHQVIFLTDGSVGNESALFDIIHKNLGNSRLFTIGIGSAPNSYFMRKAAQFGRGSFTYISDVNEVNNKMTSLFSKLESPLMTDIKLHFDQNIVTEIWPERLPDLYNGEPVILAIKSDKPLQEVTLTGTRALSPWRAKLNLKTENTSKGIGIFWARKKIAALMDSIQGGANKEQVRANIIDVALTHHLVSKYTSLVAVDKIPSRPVDSRLDKTRMPVNLPHGQSTYKTFGRLPQTATSAKLNLLFGFSLMMLGLALAVLLRQPVPTQNTSNQS